MNNPNNGSEAGSSRNALTWLSDYAWLVAGCLFVLVAVRSNSENAEDADMRRNRERIEAMARTDRDRLRHNQSEFQQLTAQDERRLRELHNAVSSDERLERTLSRWHDWLATLTIEQRENVLSAKTPQERMEIVRNLRREQHERSRRGEWPDRRMQEPPWARGKQSMRFRPEDYRAMLNVAARWCQLPTQHEKRDARSELSHHILIVTTLLDKSFPIWDQLPGSETDGQRSFRNRPEMPASLRDQLINAIEDENTRRMFRDRTEAGRSSPQQGAMQSVMLMTIFARGLFEETRRGVGSQPMTEDDRLAIYLNLPPETQREFDQLPSEAFKFRIQWIAMRQSLDRDTAVRLERLTKLFERMNNRRPGGPGQNPGRGPDGNDQRRQGDRPPGASGRFEGTPGGAPRTPR